ncbi:MAG: nucleotidyl transferase AbiEii/AbiGii toxin family protein [Deltaproteobacteria bacterium]|nr:nucleotidyl transferase AbiEii/AbiGii toxin family protein [Deltaproteobacteria bacterium]
MCLVGGTALSAYYAEHRYSYDLDLFAATDTSFKAATQAVKTIDSENYSLTCFGDAEKIAPIRSERGP